MLGFFSWQRPRFAGNSEKGSPGPGADFPSTKTVRNNYWAWEWQLRQGRLQTGSIPKTETKTYSNFPGFQRGEGHLPCTSIKTEMADILLGFCTKLYLTFQVPSLLTKMYLAHIWWHSRNPKSILYIISWGSVPFCIKNLPTLAFKKSQPAPTLTRTRIHVMTLSMGPEVTVRLAEFC